ncbi:MAG TPA: hypothetical protein IAC79_03935 [Candidatus Spyradenecus faecavium]|uniref:Uncharacterized protein n=1 Tax=Candidatus Spyradenecus faecavium TaxID=2840947 RepID=A0A9D1NNK6_9BACT|nr:hypothetical protein [Candidatus Spyradenecus faecavium]
MQSNDENALTPQSPAPQEADTTNGAAGAALQAAPSETSPETQAEAKGALPPPPAKPAWWRLALRHPLARLAATYGCCLLAILALFLTVRGCGPDDPGTQTKIQEPQIPGHLTKVVGVSLNRTEAKRAVRVLLSKIRLFKRSDISLIAMRNGVFKEHFLHRHIEVDDLDMSDDVVLRDIYGAFARIPQGSGRIPKPSALSGYYYWFFYDATAKEWQVLLEPADGLDRVDTWFFVKGDIMSLLDYGEYEHLMPVPVESLEHLAKMLDSDNDEAIIAAIRDLEGQDDPIPPPVSVPPVLVERFKDDLLGEIETNKAVPSVEKIEELWKTAVDAQENAERLRKEADFHIESTESGKATIYVSTRTGNVQTAVVSIKLEPGAKATPLSNPFSIVPKHDLPPDITIEQPAAVTPEQVWQAVRELCANSREDTWPSQNEIHAYLKEQGLGKTLERHSWAILTRGAQAYLCRFPVPRMRPSTARKSKADLVVSLKGTEYRELTGPGVPTTVDKNWNPQTGPERMRLQ